MNVIISNKYQSMLESLDIEIIKSISGEFEADEIIDQFKNFFYQRMILDITAIKNYKDIRTLQKLSISLDMNKVILLLDDSPESSAPQYLSKLISMGIYNFTKNLDGIMYLYNNPNSYRDVAQYQQLDDVPYQTQSSAVPMAGGSAPMKRLNRVIGIKNVTDNSGATTLVYMMVKALSKNYTVVGIEAGKRDFMYFRDSKLISADANKITEEISKNSDKEVIIVDVNNVPQAMSACQDMVYLIEPSVIKLNKLMLMNRELLTGLRGKKVILNQSLLSSKDVLEFNTESRLNIFYNMPPLDEREAALPVLNNFLVKLGFERQMTDTGQNKKNSILGVFGH